MKKNIFKLSALLLVVLLAAGCTPKQAEETPQTLPAVEEAVESDTVDESPAVEEPQQPVEPDALFSIRALKGPTGMGMVKLYDDFMLGNLGADYGDMGFAATPDEITSGLISGEIDIAAVPINLASVIYNKTNGGIKIAAVNTLGVLYVLENGNTINSIADLEGKTLYATGQGSTPEYILNYLLSQNGLEGKVTIEYKNDHTELATLIAAGEIDIAMLPEPNVTAAMLKNPELRLALDLTAEWDKLSTGATLTQGCIVVSSAALESNPEAVARFLAEYKASVDFVNANIDDAASLIAKYEIVGSEAIAKSALPRSNIVCVKGEDMKTYAKAMLEILFGANPASVGGAMVDDNFYYMG